MSVVGRGHAPADRLPLAGSIPRELENTMQRLVVLADADEIGARDLPMHMVMHDAPDETAAGGLSLDEEVEALERRRIIAALRTKRTCRRGRLGRWVSRRGSSATRCVSTTSRSSAIHGGRGCTVALSPFYGDALLSACRLRAFRETGEPALGSVGKAVEARDVGLDVEQPGCCRARRSRRLAAQPLRATAAPR